MTYPWIDSPPRPVDVGSPHCTHKSFIQQADQWNYTILVSISRVNLKSILVTGCIWTLITLKLNSWISWVIIKCESSLRNTYLSCSFEGSPFESGWTDMAHSSRTGKAPRSCGLFSETLWSETASQQRAMHGFKPASFFNQRETKKLVMYRAFCKFNAGAAKRASLPLESYPQRLCPRLLRGQASRVRGKGTASGWSLPLSPPCTWLHSFEPFLPSRNKFLLPFLNSVCHSRLLNVSLSRALVSFNEFNQELIWVADQFGCS